MNVTFFFFQLLHPHINSWGSLLRMYGKGSCKTLKEKKVSKGIYNFLWLLKYFMPLV